VTVTKDGRKLVGKPLKRVKLEDVEVVKRAAIKLNQNVRSRQFSKDISKIVDEQKKEGFQFEIILKQSSPTQEQTVPEKRSSGGKLDIPKLPLLNRRVTIQEKPSPLVPKTTVTLESTADRKLSLTGRTHSKLSSFSSQLMNDVTPREDGS